MIFTLFITVITEGVVVTGYSIWRKKPVAPILFTSICGNLMTQSLLWIVLHLFPQHYLVVLFTAEILIWILEGLLFYSIPANQLHLTEAILLSLSINTASFVPGWFLPV